jgi:signal peptidase II
MILLYFVYQLIEKYKENKSMLGEALILSGGIGNLIDRFYYDAVIDFIFIKAPLVDFLAIANCADIFITVGSIIIIIELIYKK